MTLSKIAALKLGNGKRVAEAKASTKPARAARLSPEARRAQLIACAITVFAREGISHSNHTLIATESRVSLAAVFAYFPTHEDLTRAVLDFISRFMLEQLLLPRQTGAQAARVEIEETLAGFADMIDTHRDITRVWLDWSTAVRDETWTLYLEHHAKVRDIFEATIMRGKATGEVADTVDTKDAAWVLIGLGHMIAHMKFAGHTKSQIVHAVSGLVKSYFRTFDDGLDRTSAPIGRRTSIVSSIAPKRL